MRVAVLLSGGRHPVSGAAVVPRLEAQAIRLAAGLGPSIGPSIGLHAGPDASALAEALGQGLGHVEHIDLPATADPVPALAARLAASRPDLVLAGRRGHGGPESGLVPYALAEALDLPLIPDVVAVAFGEEAGTLRLDQSLGRGALRRVVVRLPVMVTIHPDAPPPRPFAYGQARRGRIEAIPLASVAANEAGPALEERPYRRRPKIVKGAPAGGSAAERLKAATGEAGSAAKGRLLVEPDPEDAAREILAYLRRIGVLAPPRPHDSGGR